MANTGLSDEARERLMAEDIWLNYYNRYLFEHGSISEKEYDRMTEAIASRKGKQRLDKDRDER